MGKFKFRLESVKHLRAKEEEKSRIEFGRAQSAVKDAHKSLQDLFSESAKRGDELRDRIASGISVSEIALYEIFRMGQEVRAEKQQEVVEEKVNDMVYAFREWMGRKKVLNTFEKLEEKKREEFKKEEFKKEKKDIDELVVTRFKHKQE